MHVTVPSPAPLVKQEICDATVAYGMGEGGSEKQRQQSVSEASPNVLGLKCPGSEVS